MASSSADTTTLADTTTAENFPLPYPHLFFPTPSPHQLI